MIILSNIRSLQAYSEKRLEWIFLFGALEMLADKPNIKHLNKNIKYQIGQK